MKGMRMGAISPVFRKRPDASAFLLIVVSETH